MTTGIVVSLEEHLLNQGVDLSRLYKLSPEHQQIAMNYIWRRLKAIFYKNLQKEVDYVLDAFYEKYEIS